MEKVEVLFAGWNNHVPACCVCSDGSIRMSAVLTGEPFKGDECARQRRGKGDSSTSHIWS